MNAIIRPQPLTAYHACSLYFQIYTQTALHPLPIVYDLIKCHWKLPPRRSCHCEIYVTPTQHHHYNTCNTCCNPCGVSWLCANITVIYYVRLACFEHFLLDVALVWSQIWTAGGCSWHELVLIGNTWAAGPSLVIACSRCQDELEVCATAGQLVSFFVGTAADHESILQGKVECHSHGCWNLAVPTVAGFVISQWVLPTVASCLNSAYTVWDERFHQFVGLNTTTIVMNWNSVDQNSVVQFPCYGSDRYFLAPTTWLFVQDAKLDSHCPALRF